LEAGISENLRLLSFNFQTFLEKTESARTGAHVKMATITDQPERMQNLLPGSMAVSSVD
jgi:hypothetical protein